MLRKILLLAMIVCIYAPFGLNVQAETDNGNGTVDQMFQTNDETKETNKQNSPDNDSETEAQTQTVVEEEPPQIESQFSWLDFVKMFLALGVVIALIYIILRFINKKNRLFGQLRAMENLGGISVGPNRSIQLVRIGETVLIVGVGETIQLLKEITSPEEINQLINQNENQPMQLSQSILTKFFPKHNDQSNQENSSTKSFSSIFKGQLEDLAEGRKKVYDKFKKDHEE